MAPSGSSFDPQDILIQQWSTTGREIHLNGQVLFLHLPIIFTFIMATVLMFLKYCKVNSVMSHSLAKLKKMDNYPETLVSDLAEKFTREMNKNRKVVVMRSVCEAAVGAVLLVFLICISISYGLPGTHPYTDGFDCALLLHTTRGDRHELVDRVVTHCSLSMSQAYGVAYTIFWVWIALNIVLGCFIIIFRSLITFSLAFRRKYFYFLLGQNNILGEMEMYEELLVALSPHDFCILLSVQNQLGGRGKRTEPFQKFAKSVTGIIYG